MAVLPKSVEKVIEAFERLPGVGPKSAARMAYFFLRAPKNRAEDLANSLVEMKEKVVRCSSCFNVADRDPCDICSDSGRDHSKLCVVEEPLDVVAIEKSGVYDGVYFVLGGAISPADGIGPEELRMSELRRRIEKILQDGMEDLEVIIGTNPTLEGEATAAYVKDLVREINYSGKDLVVSRLARGLPTGADLEYADSNTLKKALEGRTRV